MAQINAAILGLGVVGRSFARLAQSSADLGIDVVAVSDRSGTAAVSGRTDLERFIIGKERGIPVARTAQTVLPNHGTAGWTGRLRELGAHAVVDCIQTNVASGEPGLTWMLEALRDGLDVVTVDKGPVAHGFRRLSETASLYGTRFRFSGTAGVNLAPDLQATEIEQIEGVLNGTTNYILTRMLQAGASLPEALADAQRMGIAEPDPRLDIEGWDSACKIVILGNALMRGDASLDRVDRHGIDQDVEELVRSARSSGNAVRLVARARRHAGGVDLVVRPEVVGPQSPLYSIDGTSKVAVIDDTRGNRRTVRGLSGRAEIARTIVCDLESLVPRPLSH